MHKLTATIKGGETTGEGLKRFVRHGQKNPIEEELDKLRRKLINLIYFEICEFDIPQSVHTFDLLKYKINN